MGLRPGVEYTYETVEGVTWATDSETGERRIIGWNHMANSYDRDLSGDDPGKLYSQLKEDQLWRAIRQSARTNKTLQSALEECIIIYKLSKEYQDDN